MNLVLLEPSDLDGAPSVARVTGRRAAHIRTVLRADIGDSLRVGIVDGKIGTATVRAIDDECVELAVLLADDPPPPLPVLLLLALPRPKVARRVLQTLATMGVKRIVLMNTARVEKSYWESPYLEATAVHEQLVLGLEQGGDTTMPTVELARRLRPFVEDELDKRADGSVRLVAHPTGRRECPRGLSTATTLAIGPEGGFTPFEIDLLAARGFEPVTLGPRRLRVEQAVPALLARLF